ncbi:hypothetical protein HK57_00305 [Aspergillus ustus]|uniref:Capsule polysaccharide biosynthesis protein n=1 Tax=Aspergillus ustus TaxID=40382 RepID=A0A0C1C472_ASPUT|nr:hypothetical protein HK57_00305 [Aspergillus ustus]
MSPHAKFTIPKEFQDQLEPAEPLDTRSDEEILASLSEHRPVTSEKNIWAYWHAGISDMPKWCQRNIIDWHRICGPSWTIRVLDTVPDSPNHALKYIPADMLPETFVKGTMAGPYVGPHSADFLRGACLYLFGGVFMDVGIILIRSLDRVCWSQLADPDSPYTISVPWVCERTMGNHFVASRKGDLFIKHWHELFVHVWQDRTSHEGMCQNPLFAFMSNRTAESAFEAAEARGLIFEWQVSPIIVFEYITQVLAWVRLTMLEDAGDGFSGVDYAMEKVLWFDVLAENWRIEAKIGFRGEDVFNLLATRLDADPDSEEYKKAYEIVWGCLTQGSMQKVMHGKNLTKSLALGSLWDLEENEGMDIKEGTFAELLRYGATRFRQTREGIAVVQMEWPKVTMKKGVYEP